MVSKLLSTHYLISLAKLFRKTHCHDTPEDDTLPLSLLQRETELWNTPKFKYL